MSPETTGAVTTFRPAALSVRAPGAVDDRARAAGYATGWAAGARAAAEAAAQQQQAVARAAAQATTQRDAALAAALQALGRAAAVAADREAPVLAGAERSVHEAALRLAAAVLTHELTPGPTSARSVLARALALPAEVGVHTVRLNPRDLIQVRALLDAGDLALPPSVDLVADAALEPGDAVSVHPTGYLDARIGAALDRAHRALLDTDGVS